MSKAKTSELVYRWARGLPARVPADVAGPEIERLVEQHGGELSASELLNEGAKKRSPLHDLWLWDDEIEAHMHRLALARQYMAGLRVVTVRYESDEVIEDERRLLWHVPPENGKEGAYTTTVRILEDQDMLDRTEQEIMRQLNGMLDRLRDFERFSGVVAEIERLNGD